MPTTPFKQRLSPEFQLLLAAARPFITSAEGQALRQLCQPGIRWSEFSTLLYRHRLPGLVFQNLERYAKEQLPKEFYQFIQKRAEQNLQHELALAAEIVRINQVLAASGAQGLFLKGPALSLQVYGRLGLRHSRDLDILIRPAELDAAHQAFTAAGYQATSTHFDLAPLKKSAFTHVTHHLQYASPRQSALVELHQRLAFDWHFLPPDFEQQAFARAMNVRIGGANVPTLALEDNLVYLCAHGAAHRWFQLKWLCDIYAYLRAPLPLDWEKFATSVIEMGLERPVAQTFVLVNQLWGVPLPAPLQGMTNNVKILPRLVEAAEAALLLPEEKIEAGGTLNKVFAGFYRLKLRKEWKYKLNVLLQTWLDEKDWAEFPLPDRLFFLYFFLRPVFWLLRYYAPGRTPGNKQR